MTQPLPFFFAVVEIGRHGREHRHRAGLLDRDEHVGGAVLQRLEAADGDAELLAGLDVFDGCLQRLVHQADGFRTERGAGLVHHTLDQRQCVLCVANRGIRSYLHRGERDVSGVQAVLGRIALLDDALGIARHQEHADAGLVVAAALGTRGHDQRIRVLAIENDEFFAVDDPAGALLLGGGGNVGQIIARVLLELRKGKGLAAIDDGGDVRRLLLGRAAMTQEAAGDHDRRQIRLQHQRLAQRFHDDHRLDSAGAEAAVGFREGQAEQALLGELAPDGFAPATLLLHVFLPLLKLVRIGEQAVDAIFEEALLLGQIEIHFFVSSTTNLGGDFRHLAPLLRGEVGA